MLTVIVNVASAEPAELVALTVVVYGPPAPALGVPLMVPVVVFKVNPGGKAPAKIEKTGAGVPPDVKVKAG